MTAFALMVLVILVVLGIQSIIHKIKSAKLNRKMKKEKDTLNAKIAAHIESKRYVRL
jgi:ABC-type multidrug transport system fused ATPase/permease subunit